MSAINRPVPKRQLIHECMQDLRRIVKALENYSRSVERNFGLTGPQLWALWELGHTGPQTLKALAARMHLDPSTMVGVVDRLESKGMMVRNQDPTDRRRLSLTLTAKAEALLHSAPHPAQGHLLAGLQRLDRSRVALLNEALHTIVRVLGAEGLEAPFFFSGK
jgi:MarR family transcriptional regulator, organic hydroperoxide resistance regulator